MVMVTSKVALVTGANKGIGLEVSRQLANYGYTVWLSARDVDRGTAAAKALRADGLDARFLLLDVTSDESVHAAAEKVGNECGRLDALINNAGIAMEGAVPPSEIDLATVRATFDVNLFGCLRVTQAFLPLLKRSTAPRIVMVSSDMGSHANRTNPDFPYLGLNPVGYISSKAALNAVTIAFANELKSGAVKVNAANPGFTATDLNGHQGVRSVEQGAAPIVRLAMLPETGPTGTYLGVDGSEPW